MTSEGMQTLIDEGFGDELAKAQLTGLVANGGETGPFTVAGRDLYLKNLVASSWQKSQPRRAIEQLNSVLISALSPEAGGNSVFVVNLSQRIRLLRVSELIQQGELEAAAELLAKCIQFRPADASIAEDLLSQLLDAGGTDLVNRLLPMLQEGFYEQLAQYPTSALLLNNLAWTNACCRANLEFSTELAERAVKLRPDFSNYLDTLAELYFLQGQRDKAIELMKQCLSQQPDKPHYRRQMRRFKDPNEN
jgi:tetratricopeptide (TPR) repeat protein